MNREQWLEARLRNRAPFRSLAVRRRTSARYALGEEQHANNLWYLYLDQGRDAVVKLLEDRLQHAMKHLQMAAVNNKDDHLAAVKWFCDITMFCEEALGEPLHELLAGNADGSDGVCPRLED